MKKNILKIYNKKFKESICVGKRGFTLVELMVVIAIIGILASVVTVNITGSIAKSKKASALTTAASILPELVTCEDDGGSIAAYSGTGPSIADICNANGHANIKWPSLGNTGWSFSVPAAAPITSAYSFTVTHPSDSASPITCSLATNGCQEHQN